MYTRDEIKKYISDILVKDFDCSYEKLTDDARLFEDLDLDSIDAVDLVVRLQSFIKKRVDPESFEKIRTLGDVINVIEKIVNEK